MEIIFASRPSRSLEVTGTGTDRSSTVDFLLVFRSNCWPISYRFRDKWQYLLNFPTTVYNFNAPAEGFPLEFCNGDGARRNNRKTPLVEGQKVWGHVHSFTYRYLADERRDGQKCHINIAPWMQYMLTRENN